MTVVWSSVWALEGHGGPLTGRLRCAGPRAGAQKGTGPRPLPPAAAVRRVGTGVGASVVRQACVVREVSCGGAGGTTPGEGTLRLGFGGSLRICHKCFPQVLGPTPHPSPRHPRSGARASRSPGLRLWHPSREPPSENSVGPGQSHEGWAQKDLALSLMLCCCCLEVHNHFLLRFYLFIYFLDRGDGREKERERNIRCERQVNLLLLECPLLGTWPETQACALTGN